MVCIVLKSVYWLTNTLNCFGFYGEKLLVRTGTNLQVDFQKIRKTMLKFFMDNWKT